MSLKDKAAKIAFNDLDLPDRAPAPAPAPASAQTLEPADPTPSGPRSRSGVAAISQSIGVHHRVQDLEEMVSNYEKRGTVVPLDPSSIRPNNFKNRHELSYSTESFTSLKAEIEAAGRNVQPIKVRRLAASEGAYQYEIVYGRRRHRACLESGLPVFAIVQQLDDLELFQEMERENRNRADLTPWEQGVMYKDAIDRGLYPSQRRMAVALSIDQGNLSKAIRLASLPDQVIGAFSSPLDLQFRWGVDLAEAFDKDPARVLVAAEAIQRLAVRPGAKDVYARLIGATDVAASPGLVERRDFLLEGKVAAVWIREPKGAGSLKIRAGALSAARERKLVEFLERLFS